MYKRLKPFAVLLSTLFFACSLNAQNFDIDDNLFVPPPYPTNLDAYVDYLEQGIVQLNNTSSNSIETFFQVRLREKSGRLDITTNIVTAQSLTVAPGLSMLTSMDISDIFSSLSEADIRTSGLSPFQREALLLNKQLPEGTYELCVLAFNSQMEPISDPERNGCFEFEIIFPDRPIINFPFDHEVIADAGPFNITWTQNLPPEAMMRTEYTLTIIDLTEQIIDADKVQNAFLDPGISPDYEEEVGNITTKLIQKDIEMPLIPGNKYAVRVTAVDPQGFIAYQFGGHSEIVHFTYGVNDESIVPELEAGILIAPKILTPEDNSDVQVSENIAIKWEHDIQEKEGLTYTLKIIDKTNEVNASTLTDKEDFEKDTYKYVFNGPIVSLNTLIKAESAIWIKDHDYSFIIKVQSADSLKTFKNDGYSDVVNFSYKKALIVSIGENCGEDMIAKIPSDQISIKLKEKKQYTFGMVELYVNKGVTGSERDGYKGTGYITVKLSDKNVKVKVDFEGLKVNEDKKVFAGTAKGQNDSNVNLDEKIAKYISGNSDLPFDEIAGITTYARLETKIKLAKKGKEVALPLGIDRDVAGEKIVVGISEMNFNPERASLTALFSIDNPEWGNYVPTLGATDVCFSKDGLGDNVKLYLAKDFDIPIKDDVLKIKASVNKGQDELLGTYVKFGKSKSPEGQITAEIGISRKILLPENSDGSIMPTGSVKAILSGKFE